MNERPENRIESVPAVNYFLIAVNTLVFCLGMIPFPSGPGRAIMFQKGALYAPVLIQGRELYRLITSVFLHADPGHLANNMIMQFAGGNLVERNMGHVRFALLYLISGVGGNLASVLADCMSGSYGFSVGASGAVFGITGALLVLILMEAFSEWRLPAAGRSRSGSGAENPFRPQDMRAAGPYSDIGPSESASGMPPRLKSLLIRAGIMIFFLLYSGWNNPVINQAAHIGGLISGFLSALLLMPRSGRDLSGLYGY